MSNSRDCSSLFADDYDGQAQEDDRNPIDRVTAFVTEYFQNPKFDSSHDIQHVLRVRDTALLILEKEQARRKARSEVPLDAQLVHLAALMHDVDDRKYRDVTAQANVGDVPEVIRILRLLGMDDEIAKKVNAVVQGVSYSSEVNNRKGVVDLIGHIPELAVVQDADRLDAIGAIGIARCFAFGSAKAARGLGDTMEHFEEKLLKLEGMMKTETGISMATERSQRIRIFMTWWKDEGGPMPGKS